MTQANPLLDLRKQIDDLDEQILTLINKRAKCAEEVAHFKRQQDENALFYRPEREAAVLRAVAERNTGPLSDDEVSRLFKEIMSACLALEKKTKVAFLGPEGTYTQAATYKQFGHSIDAIPCLSIKEVFSRVAKKDIDYGVVPVENSTEGAVTNTLDMFIDSPLKICGEVELRVEHCLLSKDVSLEKITTVCGHPQALAQCRGWLAKELPNVKVVTASSNAEAAKNVANEAGYAAIAGEVAADIYHLSVLASNIEDEVDNTTRFVVIGNQNVGQSGQDKTSLLFHVHNEPGSLMKLLAPFSERGISLARIESRPSTMGTWEYVFFIDILGHCEDEGVQSALAQIKSDVAKVKVLGSYPAKTES